LRNYHEARLLARHLPQLLAILNFACRRLREQQEHDERARAHSGTGDVVRAHAELMEWLDAARFNVAVLEAVSALDFPGISVKTKGTTVILLIAEVKVFVSLQRAAYDGADDQVEMDFGSRGASEWVLRMHRKHRDPLVPVPAANRRMLDGWQQDREVQARPAVPDTEVIYLLDYLDHVTLFDRADPTRRLPVFDAELAKGKKGRMAGCLTAEGLAWDDPARGQSGA
jgi:hypothetical protein